MALTVKQIEKALINAGGFVSKAAKQLDVTPGAISQRVKKSIRLQQVKQDAIESTLDLAESKLISNIKAGKEASIFFYLKCKGKHRGYIEKQLLEHSGPGVPVEIKKNYSKEELEAEMKRRGIPMPEIEIDDVGELNNE